MSAMRSGRSSINLIWLITLITFLRATYSLSISLFLHMNHQKGSNVPNERRDSEQFLRTLSNLVLIDVVLSLMQRIV